MKKEKYFRWSTIWTGFLNWLIFIFQICLVVASVFGVIVYRLAVFAALTAASDENIGSISLTVTATAAVINLIIILILSYVSL